MIAFGYRKYASMMHLPDNITLKMGWETTSKDFLKNFLEICDVLLSKSVYMGERQFAEPLKQTIPPTTHSIIRRNRIVNTQRELHTSVIRKSAWIDAANRIVSFQQIGEASCYTADEPEFWPHIMELVSVGYRLQ